MAFILHTMLWDISRLLAQMKFEIELEGAQKGSEYHYSRVTKGLYQYIYTSSYIMIIKRQGENVVFRVGVVSLPAAFQSRDCNSDFC
jgi:hypothetical protein